MDKYGPRLKEEQLLFFSLLRLRSYINLRFVGRRLAFDLTFP